jgi:hypothetical protein
METIEPKSFVPSERFRSSPALPGSTVRSRLLGTAAAMAGTAGSLGGVLLLFHLASAGPWLHLTPELAAAQARCDRLVDRSARAACARAVVVQARASDPAANRFAKVAPSTSTDGDQRR